jgi:hypothetical protein
MKRVAVLTVLWYLIVLLLATDGLAFKTPTHRLINQEAAQRLVLSDPLFFPADFDTFVRFLEFPDGLNTPVNGQPIIEWFRIGGVAEDQYLGSEILGGLFRSTRHFHTPLKIWDQSGLKVLGTQFESSVRWAQNPNQFPGEKASWKDARDAYYLALTSSNQSQREENFAKTFKFLGQLMHLVADLALPAHTRDDLHPPGNSDGFEDFMSKHDELVTGFQGIDASVLQQPTGDAVATVPVARIWDTETYNGNNPGVTTEATPNGATIGLAEFTSANFFSDDTIRRQALSDPVLPFPAIDRLSPGPIDIYPKTGKRRQYLSKLGDGAAPINHMVAEGLFVRFTPAFLHRYVLDDLVYQDYAAKLLPRAIGYAAGVLDYFFKGSISGDAPCSPPRQAGPYEIQQLTNSVEIGPGQMVAVVKYVLAGQTHYLLSSPVEGVTLPPNTSTGISVFFDFPSGVPLEAECCVVNWLVYRGPYGLENDTVSAGFFTNAC